MFCELEGQIVRITYTNEETGYTVAQVRLQGRRDLTPVVGAIVLPAPGEVLIMKGEWTNHPKFGRQFKIVEYKSKVPATVHGIQLYLGSGLVKGIGPEMAKRIVKKYGAATLEIIENDIEKLGEVEGVGEKRIDLIRRAWAEQKEIRRVMIFLRDHGVSSAYATKIFKRYGDEAIELLMENPYRLARDIHGVGFVTADRIAEKLGFSKDSDLRAQAGLTYILLQMSDEGHVYYPFEKLLEKAGEILEIERQIIMAALEKARLENEIVIEAPEGENDDKAVYLTGYHLAESGLARRLARLLAGEKALRSFDEEKAVSWVEKELGLRLAQKQREAVKRAARDKVLVITGGPGTGKTTIIRSVLAIFRKLGAKALLAAPTGRAAKRMNEATGFEAKTIHRLLDFSWQHGGFKKNEKEPLVCDLLVVDEASMIDVPLMHHLLKAIPLEATLILVGDVDQLPSVGPGNVLGDIIASGVVPVATLTEIFRQAKESSIIVNAHRINQGLGLILKSAPEKIDDFYFIEREQPEEAVKTIVELAAERIPKRFGLDSTDDIQVLCPMHRGALGAGNLNLELQNALNPQTKVLARAGYEFRLKDKVMQISNNYDREVFNGDQGRISKLDFERQEASITFDGREVVYAFSDLDEVVLAYAVTVHKAQGSEFPAVIVPIHTQHYMLLQRNLIYTAVTRGRKLVVLVGTQKALAMAIKNDRTKRRFSRLASRIESGVEPRGGRFKPSS